MRRWLHGLLLVPLGCAPGPGPSTPTPTPPASTEAPRTPAVEIAAQTVPEPARPNIEGPDAVRCGVHDGPFQRNQPKPVPPEEPADTELTEKARLGNSAGQAKGRAPRRFTLQPAPPPGNAPLERGTTLLVAESLTRDGAPLTPREEAAWLLPEPGAPRRGDVSACTLTTAPRGSTVTITVALAATGHPYAASAHGSGLNGSQRRCLATLGCEVALAPRAEPSLLEVRGQLAHTAPRFAGEVDVITEGSSARPVSRKALQALDAALGPVARACVEAHPPSAAFGISWFTVVADGGKLVAPSARLPDEAAGALLRCLGATSGALPSLPKSVRPGTPLRTRIDVSMLARFR